uniref:Cationic amino acid transporter C-terminal domain-containing protein n=1 Tax=Megaselia scalaris TaxID=36166 RepID=T1H1G4_MEGSC
MGPLLVSIFTATCLLILLSITVQPREKGNNLFRVPWVPLVPAISIFVNVYLMLQLDYYTWIRFGFWMIVGLPMYFVCVCMYDRPSNSKKSMKTSVGCSNGTLTTLVYPEELNRDINGLTQPEMIEIKKDEIEEEPYFSKLSNGISIINVSDEIEKEPAISRLSNGVSVINVEDEIFESATDDEKSVIAMLDDVIQHEEELSSPPELDRSMSADSSLEPSLIQSSTVAIVHIEDQPEEQENRLQNLPITQTINETLVEEKEITEDEARQAAEEVIEQILTSPEILKVLEQNNENINDSRKIRLISTPHIPAPASKAVEEKKESTNNDSESSMNPLRPSKSAEDVRKLLFAAINKTKPDDDEVEEKGGIPKPPKFDPVLYKTINSPYNLESKTAVKKRPSIKEIIVSKESSPVKESSPEEETETPAPVFRAKLEEILKRGPSHKSASRQSYMEANGIRNPVIRRKSSKKDDNYKEILRTIRANKVLSAEKTRSDRNNNSVTNGQTSLLEDLRKSLKPVNS